MGTGTVVVVGGTQGLGGELADARTDQYAVGCLLYELVVGHPPLEGAPRTLITQHLAKPPVPPSDRRV